MLQQTFLGISLENWLIAAGIAIGSFFLLTLLKKFLRHKVYQMAQKTATDVDDVIANLIARINPLFFIILAAFIGSKALELADKTLTIINAALVIAFIVQAGLWGNYIIQHMIERQRKTKIESDAAAVTTFSALGFVGKIILWTVVLLLVLDNLGVNITALVAGLGVGGIAVALALQNILGDLFASLSIVLDKPFVIGDFVIIDNYLGTIEHIGLKTTRIRSLSGEQLIFSNSDMLSSRIRNYKRMQERRVLFSFGVVYQTPADKLRRIPEMVKKIIDEMERTRFDRAHFHKYGNFSLDFEVVYWIDNPDYNLYMDIQQDINLKIYESFQEKGISFAYPTQKLFLQRETSEVTSNGH